MPRVLILRAWLDTSSLPGGRGYYSPIEDGCATLIPIPETGFAGAEPPEYMDPGRWRSGCSGRPLADYMPLERRWLLHNDPRLDLRPGFYTDYYAPEGRLPKDPERALRPGDLLLFAAGLAVYPRRFWGKPRRHTEILKAFQEAKAHGHVGLYLVGAINVKDVIDVARTGWREAIRRAPVVAESPHRHRQGDRPVAVVGNPLVAEKPVLLAKPSNGRLCGEATSLLKNILGERATGGFLRQNCRRSKVVSRREAEVQEILYALRHGN